MFNSLEHYVQEDESTGMLALDLPPTSSHILDNVHTFFDQETHVRTTHALNGDVIYTYSEADGTSAFLVSSDSIVQFNNIDIPREFRLIRTLEDFNTFLENSYAVVSDRDDGTHGLKLYQRLNGGCIVAPAVGGALITSTIGSMGGGGTIIAGTIASTAGGTTAVATTIASTAPLIAANPVTTAVIASFFSPVTLAAAVGIVALNTQQ